MLDCCLTLAAVSLACCAMADEALQPTCAVPLTISSDLPCPNVPMDPTIDFPSLIAAAGLPGVLDPNSITVIDMASEETVPHALNEDFAYGDVGRVEWVVEDPSHRRFEIRFRTVATRPALQPRTFTPLIGTGDLLRYNAGEPRPICLLQLSGLHDLTGDGKPDLVGCWNYAHRPGRPYDGAACHPRVGDAEALHFGDMLRLRYVDSEDSEDYHFLSTVYMTIDLADVNGDGLLDLVYCPSREDKVYLYLNAGRRDAGGMPVFVAAGSVPRQTSAWEPCRAVDLNGDGKVDLVVAGLYLENTSATGWPMEFAQGVALNVGDGACFYDVDGDGRLDAVCLIPDPGEGKWAKRVAWQRNLGGDPPRFSDPMPLPGVDASWCGALAAVNEGPRRGILVLHDVWTKVSLYEQTVAGAEPMFRHAGVASSISAPLTLSDQAWPCVCDWDGDGNWDLLVGGGYGWPRIVVNAGTADHWSFEQAAPVFSEGKPIRLTRNEILGGDCWHDMGYPYPSFVDWDGDGLPDLIIPNETNRIFWYRNEGTREQPRFGPRQQVLCDGYPDSPDKRAKTARLANDDKTPNNPYPYQEDEPFFWRTGAGFADLNGDGLMDMVTLDGGKRQLTLFCQYIGEDGQRHLKDAGLLRLNDGRAIDDSIVRRGAHWTESFRCVDWDGDGLWDIIYSCAGTRPQDGSIYLLRNCGTKDSPVFEPPVTLCCFGEPIKVTDHGPHPAVADLDGDGRPDILTCVEWSVYPYYSHAAIQMPERPDYDLGPPHPLQ